MCSQERISLSLCGKQLPSADQNLPSQAFISHLFPSIFIFPSSIFHLQPSDRLSAMETPSSTRPVTRSQTLTATSNTPNSRKKEESEKVFSRSRKGKCDRSALFDITNDSPIIGIAMGSLKTPNSVAKNGCEAKQTPGSGEVLLRGQVKTLLQMVEEEAEISKLSFDARPFPPFEGLLNSPMGILAPTPANTPLISNLLDGGDANVSQIVTMPVAHENSNITELVHLIDGSKQESHKSQESLITLALQFDSPVKSEKPLDKDEEASAWSVQARMSLKGEGEEDYGGEVEGDYEEGEVEGDSINELCRGLRLMCVEEKKGLPEFVGRHTRFIYNGDGEIEGEEVVVGPSVSPSVLRLKGMPLPEGKHLRFTEGED